MRWVVVAALVVSVGTARMPCGVMKRAFLSLVVLTWLTFSLDAGNCIAKENKPVVITLDQIIDRKLIQDEIEPGTYRNEIEFGPAAYDLGPYVHRYFIDNWDWGWQHARHNAGKVLGRRPQDRGFFIGEVGKRLTSCVIAVELRKLLKKAGETDFLIMQPTADRFKAQQFITKHFFVFTDIETPPNTEVFDIGNAYKPLGYSFPAIKTLPLGFAKKWGEFLRKNLARIEADRHQTHERILKFYPLHPGYIVTNIHLCSLEEIKPEVIEALCGKVGSSSIAQSNYQKSSEFNYQFCLCGLREITEGVAQAMVSSGRRFWLSSQTKITEDAEKILRNGHLSERKGGSGHVLGQIPGLNTNRFTLCVHPKLRKPQPTIVGGIRVWTLQFNEMRNSCFSYAVLPGPGRCEHLKCFSKEGIRGFEDEMNAAWAKPKGNQDVGQQPAEGKQPKKKPFVTQFNQ